MAKDLRTFHHVLKNGLLGFASAPALTRTARDATVLGEMVVHKNAAIARERTKLEKGEHDGHPDKVWFDDEPVGAPPASRPVAGGTRR